MVSAGRPGCGDPGTAPPAHGSRQIDTRHAYKTVTASSLFEFWRPRVRDRRLRARHEVPMDIVGQDCELPFVCRSYSAWKRRNVAGLTSDTAQKVIPEH